MSHRREVKQNAKFTGILFIFALFLIILLSFGGYMLLKYRTAQYSMNSKIVGNTTSPCRVVLALQYDTEPVTVSLISPSGQRYQEDYGAKHENNTMMISTITREKGDWMVEYNTLRNKAVNFQFRAENIDKILLEDVKWNLDATNPSVSFKGNFGNGKKIQYDYDITANSHSASQSGTVKDGTATTGDTVTVKLNMKDFKSANDWQFTLNIYTYKKTGIIKENDMVKSDFFKYTKPKASKTKKSKAKKGKSHGKTRKRN